MLKYLYGYFRQISKWAENVYNIAVIVDYCLFVGVKRALSLFSPLPTIRFVANQPEIGECYNLAPVIKNLRDNADLLNAFLLKTKSHNLSVEILTNFKLNF